MSEVETERLYVRMIYHNTSVHKEQIQISFDLNAIEPDALNHIGMCEVNNNFSDLWILFHDIFGTWQIFDTFEEAIKCRDDVLSWGQAHSIYDFHIFKPDKIHIV